MTCCRDKKRLSTFEADFRHGNLVTPKFYARHDVNVNDRQIVDRAMVFEEQILKMCKYERRKELAAPQTENQIYGWLEYLGRECELNRFQFKRTYDEDLHDFMNAVAMQKKTATKR